MNDSLQEEEDLPDEGLTPDELVKLYELPGRFDATLLRGIDSIQWSKLNHAYGEASDVPALFRAILSDNSDHRDFAYHLLYGNIWHQGTVYEATSYAVPFLIHLLEFEEVPNKSSIVGLLDCITRGYPYLSGDEGDWAREWMLEQGKDFNLEVRKASLDTQKAREAVKMGMEKYFGLLRHPEADVRDETVSLLCSFPESYEVIYPALYDQILNETDASIRASIIEKTAKYLGTTPMLPLNMESDFLLLLELLALDVNLQASVRFRSSVAIVFFQLENISEEIIQILLNSILLPPDLVPVYFNASDQKKMEDIYEAMAVEDAVIALSQLSYPKNIECLIQALSKLSNAEYAHLVGVLILGIVFMNKRYVVSYSGSPLVEEKNIYYGYENSKLPMNERKRIYPILIPQSHIRALTRDQKEALKTALNCDCLWEIQSNILQMFGFPNSRLELKNMLADS
jgi:hypothetical protein